MAWLARRAGALLYTRAGRALVVGGPSAIVVAFAGLLFVTAERERGTARWVAHTHEVRAAVERVLARLADAESGQRGFLLAGRAEFLSPYAVARDSVGLALAEVRSLTRDNRAQQARVDTLGRRAATRLALLDTTLALARRAGTAAAFSAPAADRGRRAMDDARRVANDMLAAEDVLLRRRLASAVDATRRVYWMLALGTALAAVVALLSNAALADAALRADRARAALERAQASLREALAAGRVATWDWDLPSGEIRWSEGFAELGGADPRAPSDRVEAFAARVHPADLGVLSDALDRARHDGGAAVDGVEFRVVAPDGDVRWLAGRGGFVRDAAGHRVRAAGTVTDVTARRAAEAERDRLQESLRLSATMSAIGNVAAGVAHQVRNPLFGISSTVDALDATFPGRDELRPFVETLRRQVERVSRVMSELLEYGRPSMGALEPSAVGDVLAAAVSNCQPLAAARGVTLVLDPGGASPAVVRVDRQQIVQAFQNLVDNAVQHSPGGAEVRVRARPAAPAERGPAGAAGVAYVACEVRDAGPGIAPDVLPRVFEPFFTRRAGGTGLGLAIAQRIVREHGGELRADNAPEGGAVLTVLLPMVLPPAAAEGRA